MLRWDTLLEDIICRLLHHAEEQESASSADWYTEEPLPGTLDENSRREARKQITAGRRRLDSVEERQMTSSAYCTK